MKHVIIYHGGCCDGWASAYTLASRAFDDPTEPILFPATYGAAPPPDELIAGACVTCVDFSYPREDLLRLKGIAKSLVVLDHHKTARAALEGIEGCYFDMGRSGAQLAWDYCTSDGLLGLGGHPTSGGGRPWWTDYVADRDLWTLALPHSLEVNAYLMALPHTLDAWAEMDRSMTVGHASQLGAAIRLHIESYIRAVMAQARRGRWHGRRTAVVNAAYPNISDVLDRLCAQGAEIGLGWFERADGQTQFSLRSLGALDVSAIAAEYGGGGHRNAAGFQMHSGVAHRLLYENFQEDLPNLAEPIRVEIV